MAENQQGHCIQTVTGPIQGDAIGPTMVHDHVLADLARRYERNSRMTVEEKRRFGEDITLRNFYEIYAGRPNRLDLTLDDEALAAEEIGLFREAGGGTIVDATPVGMGRDPEGLARVSRAAGVNIVMGSGFHVADTHPAEISWWSADNVAREIVRDLTVGVGDTGIRAGMIGEICLNWPAHPDENKVLQGASQAQAETGAGMVIHPGRSNDAPLAHIDVVKKAGGIVERTAICHIGRTLENIDSILALADTGCYLAFDLFGRELSRYFLSSVDMPNDAIRIGYIQALIERGHEDRIMVGGDACRRVHLVNYGGPGYAHILRRVVPTMKRKGISQEMINKILIDNPRRFLAFGS